MSAEILPASPAADSLRPKRMRELGIFDGQICELIDGEKNPPHAQAIRNLSA